MFMNQINTTLKRTLTNIFSLWKKKNIPATASPNLKIQLENTIVSINSPADTYHIISEQQYHQRTAILWNNLFRDF